jgi:LPS sulfotransferase NodH
MKLLVEDLKSPKNAGDISEVITQNRVVTQSHWKAINDAQIAAGRGDAFVDIAYSNLVSDPITTIASLYEQLGETFTADAESAMRSHSAEHKKDRFGSHSYSLEEWGLDRDALSERVQPYLTRYAEYLE